MKVLVDSRTGRVPLVVVDGVTFAPSSSRKVPRRGAVTEAVADLIAFLYQVDENPVAYAALMNGTQAHFHVWKALKRLDPEIHALAVKDLAAAVDLAFDAADRVREPKEKT